MRADGKICRSAAICRCGSGAAVFVTSRTAGQVVLARRFHPGQYREDGRHAGEGRHGFIDHQTQHLLRKRERIFQHEARALAHAHDHLIKPVVEGEGQDVQHHVVFRQSQVTAHRCGCCEHVPMRKHDALRLAGGPGGVNDGGEIDVDRPAHRTVLRITHRPRVAPPHDARCAGERLGVAANDDGFEMRRCSRRAPRLVKPRFGDQRRRPAVVDQESELVGLCRGIDDGRYRARFEHRPERCGGLHRIAGKYQHAVSARDAERDQGLGNRVAAAVQLTIRDALPRADQRDLVRQAARGMRQKVM